MAKCRGNGNPLSAEILQSRWSIQDYLGAVRVRLGIRRNQYRVSPGLYAIGKPEPDSYIFVTANYKLSFDHLRKALDGQDCWILVLDTKGINVWCAAGKGTFGTEELILRLSSTPLSKLSTRRLLILPQLGAPGISAPEVERVTGFKVVYGPVRAKDLPAFIAAGLKATNSMRQVQFPLLDRLVLIPVELLGMLKPLTAVVGVLTLLGVLLGIGIQGGHLVSQQEGKIALSFTHLFMMVKTAFLTFFPLFPLAITGVILFPLLLPFLPGRAFSVKGAVLGVVGVLAYYFISLGGNLFSFSPELLTRFLPYLLLFPALVSFLALNFTGSTPYTSLSGVLKEMRIALPLQGISAGIGIIGLFQRSLFVLSGGIQ
ncbi:MAG: mercury methylation corrinoid protein HgcA [Spirochaetales bacterium]